MNEGRHMLKLSVFHSGNYTDISACIFRVISQIQVEVDSFLENTKIGLTLFRGRVIHFQMTKTVLSSSAFINQSLKR